MGNNASSSRPRCPPDDASPLQALHSGKWHAAESECDGRCGLELSKRDTQHWHPHWSCCFGISHDDKECTRELDKGQRKFKPTRHFTQPRVRTDEEQRLVNITDLQMVLYAIFSRAVCETEVMHIRGYIPQGHRLSDTALLQRSFFLAMFEILTHPGQPTGPGLQLLPDQTPVMTAAELPDEARPMFLLATNVKRQVQRELGSLRASERQAMLRRLGDSLRVAILLTPEERAATDLAADVRSLLETIAQMLEFATQLLGPHFAHIQNTAVKVLGQSSVHLQRVSPAAASAFVVPVRTLETLFCAVVWVNVLQGTDSLADLTARVRTSCLIAADCDVAIFLDMALSQPLDDIALLKPGCTLVVQMLGSTAQQPVHMVASLLGPRADNSQTTQSPAPDAAADANVQPQNQYAPIPLVPGSKVPLLGNVKFVRKWGIHAAAEQWIAAYGDVVRIVLLGQSAYIVRRACWARQILMQPNKLAPATHVGGGHAGLFFADGCMHAKLRSVLTPCFYKEPILRLRPRILNAVDMFVEALSFRGVGLGEPVDLWQWAIGFFYDTMTSVGLGCPEDATALSDLRERGSGAAYPRILHLFDAILDSEKRRQVNSGIGLGMLNDIPSAKNNRYQRHVCEIYQLAGAFVERRVQDRAAAAVRGEEVLIPSFLDACLDQFGDAQEGFEAARANVLNMIRAGTDTTAASLCWTIMEVTQHPNVERQLVEEMQRVFAKCSGAFPEDEVMSSEMPYLDAVLKEVMRLHAPANLLIRGIETDGGLELSTEPNQVGYDGKRYLIPQGARVLIDVVGLHRDARYWQNPLSFDPQRFFKRAPDASEQEAGSFLRFGGGPRTCIGNLFGLLEVKCALLKLYARFSFESLGDPIQADLKDPQKPVSGHRLRINRRYPALTAAPSASSPAAEPAAAPSMPTVPAAAPARAASSAEWTMGAQRVCVAFGSNQGTCEECAREVCAAGGRVQLDVSVRSLSEIRFEALLPDTPGPAADKPTTLLICISTYNGEPPANALAFVTALRAAVKKCAASGGSHDSARPLRHLQYAVFGMGNSNWGATFLLIPAEVDACLDALGAHRLVAMGHCDEAEGQTTGRGLLSAWSSMVWAELGLPSASDSPSSSASPASPASASASASATTSNHTDSSASAQGSAAYVSVRLARCIFASPVASAHAPPPAMLTRQASSRVSHGELCPMEVRVNVAATALPCATDVRHIELDLAALNPFGAARVQPPQIEPPRAPEPERSGSGCSLSLQVDDLQVVTPMATPDAGGRSERWGSISHAAPCYEAGDHLEVGCAQLDATVEELCLRLGIHPDSLVRLEPPPPSPAAAPPAAPLAHGPLPSGCVAGETHSVRALLASRDLSLSQALLRALPPLLAHPLSADDATIVKGLAQEGGACARAGMLTLLDLLAACPSLQLSLAALLHLTTPLRRRYYSISSAPAADPRRVSITVGVVCEDRAPPLDPYRGVSSWALGQAPVGASVMARIVPSTFRLPDDPRVPLVFICAGTGIAPFRGFWRARERAYAQGTGAGQCTLYHGCRDEKHVLYTEELEGLVRAGRLTLRRALSRSPSSPRRYAQDLLREDGAEVYKALTDTERPARVYVCGSASTLGVSVEKVLREVLKEHGGMAEEAAADWLWEAARDRRYNRDVWG